MAIISVKNLSKSYLLGQGTGERNPALRNVLGDGMRKLGQRFIRAKTSHKQPDQQEFWALREVNFEIEQGEKVGIIGRNGSGKSTLLKILSRITEPTCGSVSLSGRVASLLEVGTGFHPELTGRENIFLNGAILGMSKAEIKNKFDEIVDFAEIEQFLDTPVKRYSSGMYVRLAFSVAAHLEPEILIVDEVLAVGDVQFQKKCLGKMEAVGKEGRTILFVSHDTNAVEKFCSSAILLEKGQVKLQSRDIRETIKGYLDTGEEVKPTDWINSGDAFDNPWFKPLQFVLTDSEGNEAVMPLRNDDDVWVEIKGYIETMDPALTVGYALFTEEGHLLYWSYQTDCPQDQWPPLKEGRCLLRSKIPKNFLNEGRYRVELIASLHFRQWLLEPGVNAPALGLQIKGGLSESPYWMTRRPGILAPVIPWQYSE